MAGKESGLLHHVLVGIRSSGDRVPELKRDIAKGPVYCSNNKDTIFLVFNHAIRTNQSRKINFMNVNTYQQP